MTKRRTNELQQNKEGGNRMSISVAVKQARGRAGDKFERMKK